MKKRKAKTKSKPKTIRPEIVGAVLIFIGLMSFVSIFSDKMGFIGNFLYKLNTNLAGRANLVVPLIFMFLGTSLSFKSLRENFLKHFVCSLILFVCLIILLDTDKSGDYTLIERIHFSKEYATVGKGGGVIGASLGFFLYKALGVVGTSIVISILAIGTILYLIRFDPHKAKEFILDFSQNTKESFANLKEKIVEMKNERALAKEEKEKNKDIKDKKISKKKSKIEKDNEDEPSLEIIENDFEDDSDDELLINVYDQNTNEVINSDNKENYIKENESYVEESKEKVETKSKKTKLQTYDEIIEDEKEEEELSKDIEKSMEEEYVYTAPPIELLDNIENERGDNSEILKNKKVIEETMENFGIESKIVAINKGPVITSYELEPSPGVRLSKIVSLSDNLALSLASSDIRIEAPIPGKSVVGIEVPNKTKAAVTVRELIESDEFKELNSHLPLALGKDVMGKNIISTIDKMPHLLIAGATGSGKSVCINTIITSIIYKSSPEDVKLVLIDPKVVELSIYNGIPHLLIPVVTNPKKAQYALNWAVQEMEKRYQAFAENSVRDIKGYNKKMKSQGEKEFPRIVVIVDELADLMMVSGQEVEDYIARLAQMARAAGIYLIIATQRPSVDVITGTIKANIPSRIAFAVSSSVDSRTILDIGGAEKLLGKGDMMFYPGFYSKPKRVQGAFISDEEVERVIDFVKGNNASQMTEKKENLLDEIEKKTEEIKDKDPLFEEAVRYILTDEQASISFLQRKLKVGYSRAARIVDQMEEAGIIGPHEGSKPRAIIMSPEEIEKYLGERNE